MKKDAVHELLSEGCKQKPWQVGVERSTSDLGVSLGNHNEPHIAPDGDLLASVFDSGAAISLWMCLWLLDLLPQR